MYSRKLKEVMYIPSLWSRNAKRLQYMVWMSNLDPINNIRTEVQNWDKKASMDKNMKEKI